MIFKLIQWACFVGLLLYIGSVLISLLPLLVWVLATTVFVCSIYALLPESLRLPRLEIWLYPDQDPPLKPSHSNSPSFTTPSSHLPTSSNSLPSSQSLQPQLDFKNVQMPVRGQIPNKEEFTAFLQSKVIGQDKAIEILVRVVIGKLAAQNYPKPLVVFLPGTTGTGKTETCKALAEALGVKLNRFDMGEYADAFKSSNLMGSSKGYVGSDEGGALPDAIRHSKKYCVLLFDEVEKANPSLWRQLLAFFDEGRLTDTISTVVAPKNTICLLTSNLEAEKIAHNPEAAKDILKQTGFFPPEFIGRVDKFIPLPRLNQTDSARLTVILAKRVATRYGINLVIEQEALPALVQETFEEGEKYGGRGIQEKIMDLLGDDFIDLQGGGAAQARLVVSDGYLKAAPLD